MCSIYIRYKKRQNYSVLLNVRIANTLGEVNDWKKGKHRKEFCS